MRVLLLTQLFQPEPNHLKGLSFARELQARGFQVEVLTGFPNYPGGRVYAGYRMRPWQREVLEGVPVTRVAHVPSHSRSGLMRSLSYGSFAFSAACLGAFLVRRPDIVYVYQGPATLMIPALFLAFLSRARVVLDVQDLWPESISASGMLRGKLLERVLAAYCAVVSRRADTVVVLSPGYRSRLIERGVDGDRISVVYNWCDERLLEVGSATEEQRSELGLGSAFNVMYAGSIGLLQGLESVLDAAALVRQQRRDIRFVFVGDGIALPGLRERASNLGLSNVVFVGRQAPDEIHRYLSCADALLIHLKDDQLGSIGIPQKTQAYLAAGKPILLGITGDAAELVNAAGAGAPCVPGHPEDIARTCLELASISAGERQEMGRRGRKFYQERLSFRCGCERIAALLRGT